MKKKFWIVCLFTWFAATANAKTHRHGFFGTLFTIPATAVQTVIALPAGLVGGVAGAIKHKKPSRVLKGITYGVAGVGMGVARILYTPALAVYPRMFTPGIIPDSIATGNPRSLLFTYYGGRDHWRKMLEYRGRI